MDVETGESGRTPPQRRRTADGEQVGHARIALDELRKSSLQIGFGFQAGGHCPYMSLQGFVAQSIKILRT